MTLVVLNKTVVQHYSVETLHNNKSSLKQKRNLAKVTDATDIRLPISLNKRRASSFSQPIIIIIIDCKMQMCTIGIHSHLM